MDYKYINSIVPIDDILLIHVVCNNRHIELVYMKEPDDYGGWVFIEFFTNINFNINDYFNEDEYEFDILNGMYKFNRDFVELKLKVGKYGRKEKMQDFMLKLGFSFDELLGLAEELFDHKKTVKTMKKEVDGKFFFMPH